ncbi:MAG: alpha-galactosidase [Armatimonadota bacterium]
MIFLALTALASIFVASAAGATTYFVSPSGNDSYDGMAAVWDGTHGPWSTIHRGDQQSLLHPGDVVEVAAGTYAGDQWGTALLLNSSGNSATPITYRANGRVIIDGSANASVNPNIGILFGTNYITVDGFEFQNLQVGCYLSGDPTAGRAGVTIKNCKFHDLVPTRAGVVTDDGSTMWWSLSAGIYDSWPSGPNTFEHNLFYNIGIPTLVPNCPQGNNNWAFGIGGPALNFDRIYNNTIVNAWKGIMGWVGGLSPMRGAYVKNNIFNNLWGGGIYVDTGNIYAGASNMFWNVTSPLYAGAAVAAFGDVVANPQFVNDLAFNYQLMPGSPAIDAGANVGLPFFDSAPDLGAFESNYSSGATFETANIGDLRTQTSGTFVRLTSAKVVTAASTTFSDGTYYIEEPSRACGIKVVPSGGVPTVALWDRVTLEGVLSTDASGEQLIIVTAITSKTSGTAIGPLGMKCREVPTPTGPDTSGLLVRICGWVTYKASDGSYIYIEDGSGTKDATGNKGTRVMLSGLTTPLASPPAADQFVSVTGIVGAVLDGTKVVRVLKTRSDSDFTYTTASLTDTDMMHNWIQRNLGSDTQRRPFSFVYDGQSSSALLPGWTFSSSVAVIDANSSQRTLTYTDPASGLQLRCVSTEYSDYPAVEWTLYFKNTGSADTSILESVQALDSDIYGGSGNYNLYYADGSTMLISDFQPRQASLTTGTSVHLAPFGGRSSDSCLPFFNLAKPDGSGVTMGVGWTGQWAADFSRNTNTTVNMKAGMEITHLKLHPGEEIRTPAVLMMFWKGGDRMYGQNRLRQLLLAHYSPQINGALADPPVCGAYAQANPALFTADQHIQSIELMASHGVNAKYYWIDAGWFVCPQDNWALGVGNFDPDTNRYPNGLKPIADVAHSKGGLFSLWFEPERVMPNTWIYNNHPEWLITPPSDLPSNLMYMYSDHFNLLDLSNPTALAWVKSKVSGMTTSIGIDNYRNDFNMYPLYYWRKGEAADRQGMKEIQYITAFYDYLDTLKREHPNMLIDDCASGGRRIDFEMLKRSFILTRSDYLWDPTGQQSMTYGLSQWIPITGIGSDTQDTYKCRSGYGSHFVYSCDWIGNADNTAMWNLWVQNISKLNGVRHLFRGDFYPMGSYSTATNVWMAWQFNRADLEEGILQVFRRPDSTTGSMVYTLKGLVPTASYQISFADITGYTQTKTGTQLMQSGLGFSLNAGAATYITYRRIN